MRKWRTSNGDVAVEDMTSSHIVATVAFLRRRAESKRLAADIYDGRQGTEEHADKYLTWALEWIEVFQKELLSREDNPFLKDPLVSAADIAEAMRDPGESDELAPG